MAPGTDSGTSAPSGGGTFDPYYSEIEIPAASGDAVAKRQVVTARRHVLNQRNVPETTNLTVYGDVVVIEGVIALPGRHVTIVCRRLEFLVDPLQPTSSGGINVAGAPGSAGCAGGQTALGAEPVPAAAGEHGQPHRPGGNQGTPGAPGKDGASGGRGGTITIWCDQFVRGASLVLDASGGRGGNGGNGQPGGRGGNGLDNLNHESGKASGGAGGCGGHGGNGGAGGQGGAIALNFQSFDYPMSGVSLFVAGGIGGIGGAPGTGGNGGNGGTPLAGSLAKGSDGYQYQNGADGGGGAACGLAGYGGPAGAPGTIAIGAVRPPDAPRVDRATGRLIPVDAAQSNFEQAIANIFAVWTRADVWGSPREMRTAVDAAGKDGQAAPKEREIGSPGKPGEAAAASKEFQAHGIIVADGHRGSSGGPNMNRPARAARPTAPEAKRKGILTASSCPECWTLVDDKRFAAQTGTDLLPMVFERCRERFLFTNVHGNTNETRDAVSGVQATLAWLVRMADGRADTGLARAATTTLEHLRHGRNLFGHDGDFVALGLIDGYQAALTDVVTQYSAVELTHSGLAGALKNTQERAGFLNNLSNSQDNTLTALKLDVSEAVIRVNSALASVERLEAVRLDALETLKKKFTAFESEVTAGIQIKPDALFGAVSQMAFINHQAPAFAIPLVVGQAGDLLSKAVDDVVSDTGATVNRKYLSRRVLSLSSEVHDFKTLKQTRDGLIRADGSEEGRLMATQQQVDAICADFASKCPKAAKQLGDELAHYIDLVTTRNGKVGEYNAALTELCYLQSQVTAVTASKSKTDSWRASQAEVGLSQMAAFSSVLWRHAREQCVETLYLASRAYAMQSLSTKDIFVDVLGQLMSGAQRPDNVGATAFRTALIEFIAGRLKTENRRQTTIQRFPQAGRCRIEIARGKNPLLFAMLKADKEGTISILAPRKETDADHSSFADMAEVRLSAIRVCAVGMKTSNGVHVIRLTHPGVGTFVTERDVPVSVNHQTVHHDYRYDAAVLAPLEAAVRAAAAAKAGAAAAGTPDAPGTGAAGVDGLAESVAAANAAAAKAVSSAVAALVLTGGNLDPQRQMIGPFCQWSMRIPRAYNRDLDLEQLEMIVIDFEGTCQSFV